MLHVMRIAGLGVIGQAEVELDAGLTAITGETGAGKTMVVTGLNLLLGGRADAGSVRAGSANAVVEAEVTVPPDGAVAARVRDAGGLLDDGGGLVIARTVTAAGRSRAHLGGRAVPIALLQELGGDLVTVHGQTDQLRLRSAVAQRRALDRFGGAELAARLEEYRRAWRSWRQCRDELESLTRRSRERAQEAELLRVGLAEVERLAPQPGEDVALREEAQRLSHAEELRTAAEQAHLALAGGNEPDTADAAALLAAARRVLQAAAVHDPALGRLGDRAAELGYLLVDLAGDVSSYAASVDVDPLRLAAVEQRRADLGGLVRAHGTTVDEVLDWAARAGRRLLELDGDDDRIGELRAEVEAAEAEVSRLAAAVSRLRVAAASTLAEQATAELRELSMPASCLEVRVSPREDPDGLVIELPGVGEGRYAVGPDGVDEVEILLVPHPGAPARPLAKGASGGELSRVMLALEVVLGAVDPVPTFVFDEVDAGVGGQAALAIGRRLARLARTSQVVVVTHLPQVAAFADRHLVVSKSADGGVTESGVRALGEQERVAELARMLAGLAHSDSARAHAEELLEEGRLPRSA